MRNRALPTLLLLIVTFLSLVASTSHAAERPNIIFFLSDDQRADFLGCAGHPILKTPVIDRLAAEGTRFENAFVTTSICAASRATLFTSQWERTHGFTFGTPPIPRRATENSYPAALRKVGYRTGFVGKFGVRIESGMGEKMFDDFQPIGRRPYIRKDKDGTMRHFTEIAGDRAIDFITDTPKDQPFCLSVSFNAAHAEDGDKVNHYPWPKTEDGLYESVTIPPPLVSTDFWKQLPPFFHNAMHRDRWFWRWDTPEKYQRNVKAYYRMITGMDRVMGEVLEAVKRSGRTENTVVIFMGDNGYYKGSRGFAGKWSHFEESLRVPLVIHDPRAPKAARGQVIESMALNVDVPATIMDIAGEELPETYQGQSLMPLVEGQTPDDWRTDFFCEHLMNNAKIPKWEGVRTGRYVYARYFEHADDGEFLHDLEKDPKQLKNYVDDPAYADILSELRERCDSLRDECVEASERKKSRVYFGTYTRGGKSQGIYTSLLDPATGQLSQATLAAQVANPSFLAVHPTRPLLYAVGEIADFQDKKAGAVSAFSIDTVSGKLTLLNQQSSQGTGPCHISIDPSGQNALVANYGSGSIASLPIAGDGKLGPATSAIQHEGSSVNPRRQQGPHAHSINVDAGNRFAMVGDLGLDKVLVYRFDAEKGLLSPHDPSAATLKPGAGPRHFAFHPLGRFAYVINELHSTITAFSYDTKQGSLKSLQTTSTLPEGFDGPNSTAEVQVHPSGKFLYGSNRGHDSIAVFTIDAKSGKLKLVECESTQGKTPRNFGIDPTGTFLLAANQTTDNIVVFRIDRRDGSLRPTGRSLAVPTPVCVKVLPTGR